MEKVNKNNLFTMSLGHVDTLRPEIIKVSGEKVINATDKYIGHGYNVVRGNELNYSNILYSTGKIYEITAGIRVVVTID